MKFTITKKNFLTPIQKLNSILSINHDNPITNNILFHIYINHTYLISTNLELEITAKINCNKIFHSGEILISGKKILNIVRSFPNESEILVTVQNNIMNLQYQNIYFTLNILNAKKFPKFQAEKILYNFIINQNIFKDILYNSHYAMAKQDIRHYLNGMNFEINNGKMSTISTDGYRMAISFTHFTAIKKKISVIIPRKTVLELIKILTHTDSKIKICIGNQTIQFYLEQYTLSSKVIDNQFPKYENIITNNFSKNISISKELLKQALIRASVLVHQKLQGVRIIIKKKLCIVCSNNEHDETIQEEFKINYSDTTVELTMNINYILDVINVINSEKINFLLQNTSSIIYIKNTTLCNSYHIIMPLIL